MLPTAKQQANRRFLVLVAVLTCGGGGWGLFNYLGLQWFLAYFPELVTPAGEGYQIHGNAGVVFAVLSVSVFLTVLVAFLWTMMAWPFRCSNCGQTAKSLERASKEFLRCTICDWEEPTGWHLD